MAKDIPWLAAFNCLAQEDDEVDGECVLITFSFAHFAAHFCSLCVQALLLLLLLFTSLRFG